MGVYLFDEIAYLNQRVGNIKILNKSSLFPDYRNIYMQSKVDEILKLHMEEHSLISVLLLLVILIFPYHHIKNRYEL